MRMKSQLPFIFLSVVALVVLTWMYTSTSMAETNTITVGPWTFEDQAFADNATDISGINKIRVEGDPNCSDIQPSNFEECLDSALTGYSPNTYLVNVGLEVDSESNHYQLDFTDMKAENNFGSDIVFFECRYSENSYEFAVRPEGGDFTDFIVYPGENFIETDTLCTDPFTNWGITIDLSTFGLPIGTIVDALQFKVVDPLDPKLPPEGEPSMAAVITIPPNLMFLPIIAR